MEQQRERARASWKGAEKAQIAPAYQELLEQGRTQFLGYSELEATSRVVGLLVDQQLVENVAAGHEGRTGARPDAVLRRGRRTGGRPRRALLADRREGGGCRDGAIPAVPGLTVHRVDDARAACASATSLRAEVECRLRRRHHAQPHRDAPAARRAAPGARHARQAGRQRGGARPPALRLHATTPRWIAPRSTRSSGWSTSRSCATPPVTRTSWSSTRRSPPARWRCSARSTARRCAWSACPASAGNCAAARTCSAPATSALCKIVYEGSISAGVRRIEAVTGDGALRQFQETADALQQHRRADARLRARAASEHVEKLLASRSTLERRSSN